MVADAKFENGPVTMRRGYLHSVALLSFPSNKCRFPSLLLAELRMLFGYETQNFRSMDHLDKAMRHLCTALDL